jgi:hypothetical protein
MNPVLSTTGDTTACSSSIANDGLNGLQCLVQVRRFAVSQRKQASHDDTAEWLIQFMSNRSRKFQVRFDRPILPFQFADLEDSPYVRSR